MNTYSMILSFDENVHLDRSINEEIKLKHSVDFRYEIINIQISSQTNSIWKCMILVQYKEIKEEHV